MAAAIVATVKIAAPPGDYRWGIFTFTPSTSYPAAGEPMTASLFGMTQVFAVIPLGSVRAAAAVMAAYDGTNKTITLNTTSTGAVVSTASDQSSNVMTLLVIGI